ncbi:MAG TPA: protein kinase, partial [Gemmatimonadaceae bacterium]
MEDLREHLQASLGTTYTLERELAGGGMSRVFLAEETALRRKVVIKVLPPELKGAVLVARFQREISVAANLQHAHIVPLHAAGDCDGLPFFAMPFVRGESLRVRLAKDGVLPIGEVMRLLREIASALAYAHEHGVVHRDIKPDNILLSGDAAMVTDFGVAKALELSTVGRRRQPHEAQFATSMGIALGTPAYMAPEQAAGEADVDYRADVYALGATAYEMLTGQPPFTSNSPAALIAAQISQIPDPVSTVRRDTPPALASLIMSCLAKLPDDRPQSASEIVRRLDAMSTEVSVPRHAQSRGGSSKRRLTARQLWWAGSAALVVLTIVIGTRALRKPTAQERPRLAVLPFDNLGPAADEYFADGLTEEVSTRLTSLSGLAIVGRATAQSYKQSTRSEREIAAELRVAFFLTGTVRWERLADGTSRVRVSPRLVRVDDGTSAWSNTYEGPLADVFKFQAAVAERVAEAMSVALPARERLAVASVRTRNLEAYDAYLRGLASSSRERLFQADARRAAISEFQRAATLDPSFSAAHARLALAYVYDARIGGERRALEAAAGHLQRAVQLDSTSSETRLALAWYALQRDELDRAHAAVQSLMRSEPTNSHALYVDGLIEERLGRADDAIESYQSAAALEPKSSDPPAALAQLYDALGRHADALQTREREISLTPTSGAAYFAQAASHLLWRYDTTAARRELQRGIEAAGMSRMLRLPNNLMLDWGHVLPPSLVVALDTLTRAGAATAFPGLLFDDAKVRFHTLMGRPDRARVFADSLVGVAAARRQTGDFETGLLIAPAYVALGRVHEAQRESDATFGLIKTVSDPRRHIPGVITIAWVDMATGRPELALDRLETVAQPRSGFYLSRA